MRIVRRTTLSALTIGLLAAVIVTPIALSAKKDGVAAAKAYVAAHSKPPASIGKLPPVSKKPATGKRVDWLECGVPVCKLIGKGLSAATKALGWKLKVIPMGTTPEQIGRAWTTAVEDSPDAVLATGVVQALFKSQLAQLKAKGIPYVAGSTTDPNTNGQIGNVPSQADYVLRGSMMANFVVANTNGAAKAVMFNIPDFPVLVIEQKAFAATFKKLCPSCSLDVVNVSATDIGSKLPGRAVSYMQQHPDTNYMVAAFGDMTLGVPQALKAAGLDSKLRIISQASGPNNFQNIKKGLVEYAAVPEPDAMAGWRMIDVLVRSFNGDPLACCNLGTLPRHYLTKSNIGNPALPYVGVPGYPNQFLKLWKVK